MLRSPARSAALSMRAVQSASASSSAWPTLAITGLGTLVQSTPACARVGASAGEVIVVHGADLDLEVVDTTISEGDSIKRASKHDLPAAHATKGT